MQDFKGYFSLPSLKLAVKKKLEKHVGAGKGFGLPVLPRRGQGEVLNSPLTRGGGVTGQQGLQPPYGPFR